MSIGPIEPIGAIAVPQLAGITEPTAVDPASGVNFANALGNGLDHLQSVQNKADDLAVQAATGTLTDVHDYMIAATDAQLTTQLTIAVRNKALDAFNEIMRMQA
jgi:flagellar hook-basal body complex protein FliE